MRYRARHEPMPKKPAAKAIEDGSNLYRVVIEKLVGKVWVLDSIEAENLSKQEAFERVGKRNKNLPTE